MEMKIFKKPLKRNFTKILGYSRYVEKDQYIRKGIEEKEIVGNGSYLSRSY